MRGLLQLQPIRGGGLLNVMLERGVGCVLVLFVAHIVADRVDDNAPGTRARIDVRIRIRLPIPIPVQLHLFSLHFLVLVLPLQFVAQRFAAVSC